MGAIHDFRAHGAVGEEQAGAEGGVQLTGLCEKLRLADGRKIHGFL